MMLSSMYNRGLFGLLICMLCLALPSLVLAQESQVFNSQLNVQEIENVNFEPTLSLTEDKDVEEMIRRIQLKALKVRPDQISSLFFTSWEHNLLADARRGLVARPPTESEVEESQREQESEVRPPRGPRELSLSGIVFVSSSDWTIWLNNQKVTSKRLPPEILDIRVRKDYIEVKWFDAYTNQVFPIKLKTHQRFNIDTRIFLPG